MELLGGNSATEHFVRPDGIDVWTLDVPYLHARMRRVITLSADTLLVALFAPHHDMDSAVAALREQQPPAETFGRKATVIQLADIRRVVKLSKQRISNIHYSAGSKQKSFELTTPGCDLYADVFAAIHQRIGGRLPITTRQATIEQSLRITPITGLVVLALLFTALAAIFPEEIERDLGHGPGAVPSYILQHLGASLGRFTGWAIAASIICGIVGTIIYRLRYRPDVQSFEVRRDPPLL